MIYLEVVKEFDSTYIYSVSSAESHYYGWGGGSGVWKGVNYKLYTEYESLFQTLLGPNVLDRWLE